MNYRLVRELEEKARDEYHKYVEKIKDILCLVEDDKIKGPKFVTRKFHIQEKAAQHYGKHSAYAEIINILKIGEIE